MPTVVYNKKTGERLVRENVDAREIVASNAELYTLEDPNPEPPVVEPVAVAAAAEPAKAPPLVTTTEARGAAAGLTTADVRADQLQSMTVEELRGKASAENINLRGAHTKADIIKAIMIGDKFEPITDTAKS